MLLVFFFKEIIAANFYFFMKLLLVENYFDAFNFGEFSSNPPPPFQNQINTSSTPRLHVPDIHKRFPNFPDILQTVP